MGRPDAFLEAPQFKSHERVLTVQTSNELKYGAKLFKIAGSPKQQQQQRQQQQSYSLLLNLYD